MSRVLLAILSLFGVLFAAFCVFGFLASHEPGVSPVWKIGYAAGFVMSMAVSVGGWFLLPPRT